MNKVFLEKKLEELLSTYPNIRNHEMHKVRTERVLYLNFFQSWGFGDWMVFKKLILHFYPQVSENELKEFYKGSVIRQDVLKYVKYVYQIFQK